MKKILTGSLMMILMMPSFAEAKRSLDHYDLDDEAVEDVYMPLLFAMTTDDLVPDFGQPRGGGYRSHEGQDMLVPRGTPVVSPTEAVVIDTGVWTGAGNYVVTANPGGETFHYYHLDTIEVRKGNELDVGDMIGTVGDTGNAPDGAYHLHFEIRDRYKDAMDPYPRLTRDFSLKKQVSFLKGIFKEIRNDEDYAYFLVEEFPDVFMTALEEGWSLPREIRQELEDREFDEELDAKQDLNLVLQAIPKVLSSELEEGDSGVLVSLLQLFLIYTTDNADRDRLAAAGPTGYYGPITTNAIKAYQDEQNISETGEYDTKTRARMMKRAIVLNL